MPVPRPKAVAAALLALVASCSRAPAPEAGAPVPLSVQADWYAEAEQGGNYQAIARGYYRAAGLDVSFLDGGPGGFPIQKVAAGNADMALGRSDDVILGVARAHLPLVIVCAYMEKDPMAVLVHDESPVRDFPDLAGRVVMADPVSAWISYLKARYAMEFSIVPLNYGLGEFMADPNLVVQGFATSEPFFVRQKGGRSRTLLIAGSGYRPYRVIFANAGFVRRHPDAVRAFVSATIRGWTDFMDGDPGPARRLILERNQGMTDALFAFSMDAMRRDHFVEGDASSGERIGLMTRRRLQEQVDLFVRLKVIPEPVPLEQFVRFDFLPADLAALAD